MTNRVAILHYAGPPVIGGVESTIAHHARELAQIGYPVRVICGTGATFDERVETVVEPLFSSNDPRVLAVKRELDRGVVPDAFHDLVQRQREALGRTLDGIDVCVVHNVHTMNKNLALTAALHDLNGPRMIAWCHDLAWANAQYGPELHAGAPWDLLRRPWPRTTYVTVSKPRQGELAALLQIDPADIGVVTAGVDVAAFLGWTRDMRRIAETLSLLDADLVLLLPARITRRKNIELALRMLAALRGQTGADVRLVVTGPPGPHNPANPGYLGELIDLRRALGLEAAAHFLYELAAPAFSPDDATMANLYQLADALFFPSIQEGFGIPIIEAGLAGLPVFCADLPPLRHTGQGDVAYFDPERDSPEAIARRVGAYFDGDARQRLKCRVRRDYRWDAIVRTQLVPLIDLRAAREADQ